jgi:hypothetical protein
MGIVNIDTQESEIAANKQQLKPPQNEGTTEISVRTQSTYYANYYQCVFFIHVI